MNCPVCESRMKTIEKHGVELDICPDCKGVWLDRGELEKIIQMVEGGEPVRDSRPERPAERPQEYRQRDEHSHGREDDYSHDKRGNIDPRTGKPKRKESILGQIFDAFGGGED